MSITIALVCSCFLACACDNDSVEKRFFNQPLANRVERLRQYDLADQYKIFRYGVDSKEPPFMELALPIAERGATAVPLLLEQLNSRRDDVTLRDLLMIFEEMASSKSYDVKSDAALMATLTSRVSETKGRPWYDFCLKQLQAIKGSR